MMKFKKYCNGTFSESWFHFQFTLKPYLMGQNVNPK